MRREYVVTLSEAEVTRLREFDNKTDAAKHWPLGPNRSFRRTNGSTFVVKEYSGSPLGSAYVMTLGEATLLEGSNQVLVTVRTKAHGFGYLLIIGGVVVALATPREGIAAILMGVFLVAAGWFLFVRRPGEEDDLDQVEQVLRAEIRGHWQPVDADPEAAYTDRPAPSSRRPTG
ncbi:hypothetical protein [Nocardioides conyzicola]|uniref:Uncharacterized protein n=1 Tax=Nocardioides conyzicola TaxID=1651781 RepID=A0ABP8Y044_9ACTN